MEATHLQVHTSFWGRSRFEAFTPSDSWQKRLQDLPRISRFRVGPWRFGLSSCQESSQRWYRRHRHRGTVSACLCPLAALARLPPEPSVAFALAAACVLSCNAFLWPAQVVNFGGDKLEYDAELQPWPTSSSRCPDRPREARRARRKESKSIVDGTRAADNWSRRFVVEPPARGSGARVIARGLSGFGRGRYPLSYVVAHVCR